MSQKAKRLAAMRDDPRGDWTVADVQALCRDHGITCQAPAGGSHYVLSHPAAAGHLTVPARRPIKPVHIRLLVAMVEGITAA